MRMSPEQFAAVSKMNNGFVSIQNLEDRSPRTLLLGYDHEHCTIHVYLGDDGCIHRVIYTNEKLVSHTFGEKMDLRDLRGSKRSYPECTDFEFARLMMSRGIDPQFTSYSNDRPAQRFYGYRADELTRFAAISEGIFKLSVDAGLDDNGLRENITALRHAYLDLMYRKPFKNPVQLLDMIESVKAMDLFVERSRAKRQLFIDTAQAVLDNRFEEIPLRERFGPLTDFMISPHVVMPEGAVVTHLPTNHRVASIHQNDFDKNVQVCMGKVYEYLKSIDYEPVPMANRNVDLAQGMTAESAPTFSL